MGSINEEDAWVLSSLARNLMCVGDNPIELGNRLVGLSKERFKRLSGLCSRLGFVEQLRHTVSLVVSEENARAARYQLHRLTAYLAATCIDIATGDSYQKFEVWLRKAHSSRSWGAGSRGATLENLKGAETDADLLDQFVRSVSCVDEDYRQNMSMRRAFRRFISDIDPSIRDWIVGEFGVQPVDEKRNPIRDRWEELAVGGKCDRIGLYLYDLRNTYTHTVAYYDPIDSRQRFARRVGIQDGHYVSTVFPASHSGEHDRVILLREGVDETEMIQFLVIAWLKRNWLGIQDDSRLIGAYRDRARHRRLALDFLFELRGNVRLVHTWCSYHLYPHTLTRSQLAEVQLDDRAARAFEVADRSLYNYLERIAARTDLYLEAISSLNAKVVDFGARHTGSDWVTRSQGMEAFYREISALPETARLVHAAEYMERYLLPMLKLPYC